MQERDKRTMDGGWMADLGVKPSPRRRLWTPSSALHICPWMLAFLLQQNTHITLRLEERFFPQATECANYRFSRLNVCFVSKSLTLPSLVFCRDTCADLFSAEHGELTSPQCSSFHIMTESFYSLACFSELDRGGRFEGSIGRFGATMRP